MVGVLPWSAQMPRYYFHTEENGVTLDDEGTELYDHAAARDEAVFTSSGILRDSGGPDFWSGKPWRLWVTDQPGGARQHAVHHPDFGNGGVANAP